MKFTKMHALGNDFILIDARSTRIKKPSELSKKLCKRRFGIGADQMLVLEKSKSADFKMRIFNADGSEVEMCGNGIRCLARYIWDRRLSKKKILAIETLAGIIKPAKSGDMVRVDMGEPILKAKDIPVKAKENIIDLPLRIGDRTFNITCVSMGNPHAVIFMDNIEGLEGFPVGLYGSAVETHKMFPKRTNVEFVEVISKSKLRMRVWERGAGETPACGTGASAAAVASSLKGLAGKKVTVHLDGGDLHIEWAEDNRVYMTGPTEEVFLGEIKT
jgi:diaminopimelate epimerase